MASWDMTGSWVGEYWYDPDSTFDPLPGPIGFTMVVRQGWFGRFRGMIRDNASGGNPEEAIVAGRAARGRLTFRKWYPTYYVWWGDRLMTLREQMDIEHGVQMDEDSPAVPIEYQGVFEDTDGIVHGTWEVPGHHVWGLRDGRPVAWEVEGYSGGWRMGREAG